MEEKSISRYIEFGKVLRFLQDVQLDSSLYTVKNVTKIIDKFFSLLYQFKLPVTERGADKLKKYQNELLSSNEENSRLDFKEISELKKLMYTLESILDAEAEGNLAFIVTDKRIDVNKLLFDVSSLMAPDVYNSLSDIAQYDFKEAGRCIAFSIPTAAAFHLMRGTEAVLRDYYCNIYKRKRIKSRMWGPMTDHLKKRKSNPLPPTNLLSNLDNIRHSYRNPTQHPEKIYDIEEVQDLFGLCVDVVTKMKI